MNPLERLRPCRALEARVKELEEKTEVLEASLVKMAECMTLISNHGIETGKQLIEHLNAEKAAIEASIAEIEGYW